MAYEDLELGPCEAWFGLEGAETNLGPTQGGVKATIPMATADLKEDQKGDAPVDQVITGMGPAEIDIPLAEWAMATLASVIPGAIQTTDAATPTKIKVTITPPIGTTLRSLAKRLILKKVVGGVVSTNRADWVTFPVAAPICDLEMTYDATSQRVINAKFRAFPDASTGALYWFGDEDAAA